MDHQPNLNSLITTEIIPVDLNNIHLSTNSVYSNFIWLKTSILYKNEVVLSNLYKIIDQPDMATLYAQRAQQRLTAMKDLLWNDKTQTWNDKYLNGTFDERYYASNFVPFWAGAFYELSNDQVTTIVKDMAEMLSYPGGVPTSTLQTGQQWYIDYSLSILILL